jgi:V8-like Glu-specific endopeptidase
VPVETTFGESFALDTGHDPFRLPRSWLDAKPALDMATSLNVVSTVDAVGGNSGSPLVNREGKLVGLVYAINDAGEANAFGYDDTEARTIAVTLPAIRAALSKIYHADRILREIEGN